MPIIARLFLSLVLLVAAGGADARTGYAIDPARTSIGFDVSSFGFGTTHGEFGSFVGRLEVDLARPQDSNVEFKVNAASLHTGSGQLDDYIRTTFLDASEYPEMRFRSVAVRKLDDHDADVTGELTLRGVTRPVTLRVAVQTTDRRALDLVATTRIRRSDFGMSAALPIVSDDVVIRVSTRATDASR